MQPLLTHTISRDVLLELWGNRSCTMRLHRKHNSPPTFEQKCVWVCVCAKTFETGLIPHSQLYSKCSFTCQGEHVPTQVPKDLICFHTYRILDSHILFIARTDLNRWTGWNRGRGESSSTKENDPELGNGFLAAIWRKKVPRHTKDDLNTCSHRHLSLLHVSIPYIETSICAAYMRTCTSFPSSALFLMPTHYFPSVLLIPIYLHPSFCLQFTLAFLCCPPSAYLKNDPPGWSHLYSFWLGGMERLRCTTDL